MFELSAVAHRADRLACAGSRGRVMPVRAASRAPTVTVVIPCYNYGHYLPACVRAALRQPDVAVDVIIVDDASTDDSAEVAEALAEASPDVRLIRHERNAGHIATYNDGLAAAEGEYVVLISADDLLTPGALGRAAALFENHPSVGLVYGHAVRFSGEPPPAARIRPSSWMIWHGEDWLKERFAQGRGCILSPEVVVRTSVQREAGGYRHELPHTGDLEMWIRLAALSDVGFVSGADQAWYRDHDTNMHSTVFQQNTFDGMAIDYRERVRAFESGALAAAADGRAREQLVRSARRGIAVEIVTLSTRAFYWGVAQSWPIDALRALALEIYPDARALPHWRLLDAHRRIGMRPRRRDPISLSHRVELKLRDAARAWRFVRAGR